MFINNISGRICLHDRDTELAVLHFLSDIQIPTKKIDDSSLDLVRRLRLPDYLLPNTFAKKVASEIKSGSNEDDESPFTSYPRPNNEHAKWLRLYLIEQPQLSKSSQEEAGSSSLSWINDERHAQKKYTRGNCQKALGKGSRKQPSIWCNVCGWVHYKCSGLTTVTENAKYRVKNFLCSKCSWTRRLVPATQETIAYSKLHNIYTSCQNPASFGSRSSLKKESNCTFKQVDNFLRKSETYTNLNKLAETSQE